VEIVVGEVVAVHQFVSGPRVVAIARQDVDVWRAGGDLLLRRVEADNVAVLIKQFDSCQTYVVLVSPGVKDVYQHLLAPRKLGDHQVFLKQVQFLLEAQFWSLFYGLFTLWDLLLLASLEHGRNLEVGLH
jgi:hypothetical protein